MATAMDSRKFLSYLGPSHRRCNRPVVTHLKEASMRGGAS